MALATATGPLGTFTITEYHRARGLFDGLSLLRLRNIKIAYYLTLESGNVTQTCSTKYLVMLAQELFRAKAADLDVLRANYSRVAQAGRLILLERELRRLLEHPDLFASDSQCLRFFSLLNLEAQYNLSQAFLTLVERDDLHELHQDWQHLIRRSKDGETLKPWEAWLRSYAPGKSNFRLQSETNPKSVLQALPPVAMRIIRSYELNEISLRDEMRNVSFEAINSLTRLTKNSRTQYLPKWLLLLPSECFK